MTREEAFAELATLTRISADEWADMLELPQPALDIAIQDYRDADWRTSPDSLGKILAVLEVIGAIAGVVSGVAGAAGAIQALTKL